VCQNNLDKEKLNLIHALLKLTSKERIKRLTLLFNSLEAIKHDISHILTFAKDVGLLFPNTIEKVMINQPITSNYINHIMNHTYNDLELSLIMLVKTEKKFISVENDPYKEIVFYELCNCYLDVCEFSSRLLRCAFAKRNDEKQIIFNTLSSLSTLR
jgi:hypothetical protein